MKKLINDPNDVVSEALLGIEAIFPPRLAANDQFRTVLARHAPMLATNGARAALA